MSVIHYIKNEMGYKERGTWIDLIVAIGVAGYYLRELYVLQLNSPLTEVAFQGPLLRAFFISITATIVLHIIYAILSGKSGSQEDIRDRQISRFGDWVSLFPLAAGSFVGLILAMYDQHHFWTANAIYAGFIISAITGSITRLIVYRRGLGVA